MSIIQQVLFVVVRQILETFYAHDIDLHLLLIDFRKAFDSINRKKLLETLVSFGIPRKIKRLVEMTLEEAQAKVILDEKKSNPFVIDMGGGKEIFVCHIVQPCPSQSPKKFGTRQHDFEQTNTNLWICR
jgi:hypothetical protein